VNCFVFPLVPSAVLCVLGAWLVARQRVRRAVAAACRPRCRRGLRFSAAGWLGRAPCYTRERSLSWSPPLFSGRCRPLQVQLGSSSAELICFRARSPQPKAHGALGLRISRGPPVPVRSTPTVSAPVIRERHRGLLLVPNFSRRSEACDRLSAALGTGYAFPIGGRSAPRTARPRKYSWAARYMVERSAGGAGRAIRRMRALCASHRSPYQMPVFHGPRFCSQSRSGRCSKTGPTRSDISHEPSSLPATYRRHALSGCRRPRSGSSLHVCLSGNSPPLLDGRAPRCGALTVGLGRSGLPFSCSWQARRSATFLRF